MTGYISLVAFAAHSVVAGHTDIPNDPTIALSRLQPINASHMVLRVLGGVFGKPYHLEDCEKFNNYLNQDRHQLALLIPLYEWLSLLSNSLWTTQNEGVWSLQVDLLIE